jgi:AcrR family transcriptional regulator
MSSDAFDPKEPPRRNGMRYPAAETAEKHARILEQAARLFRERGFAGVSLAEIMKATGLTHGRSTTTSLPRKR